MFKNGFLKVCMITPVVKVGMPLENAKIMVEALKESRGSVTLFPELATTGYTCGDLFFSETLMKENYQAINYILENNPSKGIVIYGAPLMLNGSLFNCAIIMHQHEILGIVPKMSLPNSHEFGEMRWFQQGSLTHEMEITVNGKTYPFGNIVFKDYENQFFFGVEICEDMWTPLTPGGYLSLAGANVIFNISSSNEYFEKDKIRTVCVQENSRRNVCAYVYVSSGMNESVGETIFSGHNIVASTGNVLVNDLSYDPNTHYTYCDLDLGEINYNRKSSTNLHAPTPNNYRYHLIEFHLNTKDTFEFEHQIDDLPFVPKSYDLETFNRFANILEYSLAQRIKTIHSKTLIIGVSGGLDSTLALLIAHRAFKLLGKDPKDIIGVTMPGLGTSTRTKNNAMDLMGKLGITIMVKPISKEVLSHFKLIEHDPTVTDITYENVQARYRTLILMSLANKHNGMVLGTGDMSELALGWCTYNGDQMSMYGINGGIPKTLVRYLTKAYSEFAFNDCKDVLEDIVLTPISPELKADQVTEDSVGKYEVNDFILHRYLFCGDDKERTIWLVEKAFNISNDAAKEYVNKFYYRFFTQQFKRTALPEGPKVLVYSLSSRSDYKIPSDLSRR